MLPVLFGVLGLPLVYVLARRLLRSRAAGLGAALRAGRFRPSTSPTRKT